LLLGMPLRGVAFKTGLSTTTPTDFMRQPGGVFRINLFGILARVAPFLLTVMVSRTPGGDIGLTILLSPSSSLNFYADL
jgi:hypothetical protein